MERWHLPSIEASGKRDPRVLFSRPECRAIVLDLREGEELGEHSVHENAVVQVVSGSIVVEAGGSEVTCESGTLATFSQGERRAVRAAQPSRILLLLAPWPGKGHYFGDERPDPERIPPSIEAPPLED